MKTAIILLVGFILGTLIPEKVKVAVKDMIKDLQSKK